MARTKKGQLFELMSGERRGNTTAPNRSTEIRSRLWTDTRTEVTAKKGSSLHKARRRELLIGQESTNEAVSSNGTTNIGYSRSDMAILTINKLIGFLNVLVL